jgi:hypothetical protein
LTDPRSWNAYAYVSNDPLNAIDPTGLDVNCVAGQNVESDVSTDGNAHFVDNVSPCSGTAPSGGGGVAASSGPAGGAPNSGGGAMFTANGLGKGDVDTVGAPPKSGSCTSGTGSNSGSAWSEMFSALGSWLTSGPKYLHYGPSDPYTKDFVNSNAMLYVNNSISGSQASSGRVAVGTGRAFLFTALDALAGSPSVSEAQFGAFVATYSRSGSGTEITISNDISNDSAYYHVPSGLSMSGSYADRFGRLTGHVPTGAVLQEMTIRQCP